MCAFLPVAYERSELGVDSGSAPLKEGTTPTKTDRKELLNALYESIELRLKSIADISLEGLYCTSIDCVEILFHILLTSYIADIPEHKELPSVQRDTKFSSLCHNSLIKTASFNSDWTKILRNLAESCALLKEANKGSLLPQQTIAEYSMHFIPPVSLQFQLLGVHPSVSIYAIFRFKLMHRFVLELSKMLKECLVNSLSDSNRTTVAINYRPVQAKPS